MISILIANPKGGCGKTTIATHLAAAYANGGLATALADTDRQRSCLDWLDQRPSTAARIQGLDWTREIGKPPKGISRLVIDSAASLRMREVRELVKAADAVIIPVLPSAFDVRAMTKFLDDLSDLKPIRKNKKPYALIRNRTRLGSRAVKHLDGAMVAPGAVDVGWLTDRSVYNEVAWQGLSIFDLANKQSFEIQRDWIPIVRFIENRGALQEAIA